MRKPLLFSKGILYSSKETKMKDYPETPEDIKAIRDDFLSNRPPNLEYLLEKRYAWMNEFIKDEMVGIEIGCGTGMSKLFVKSPNFKLTDVFPNEWVDEIVDALNMPYEDSSLDYVVASNMTHHLATPHVFFKECSRVLKPGGLLVIQEINGSLAMRAILRIMRHEGFRYEVDVFDPNAICNNPEDPWSANCVIPNLLFDNKGMFEKNFPFRFIHHRYTEFLLFPLSGGQNSKRKTVSLPGWLLKLVDRLDDFLIFFGRGLFPMQRQIVLANTKSDKASEAANA